MALTKISTGGVKDDAVTSSKIPANAVGSSEIADDAVGADQIADDGVAQAAVADEAIDEARLQISNAGSNGQFLSKQSGNTGGLTWADGASEGTEVKSTGESGTGKFLRTDGDGTSSWQPVPSDNTKANLNGADFTGEVALKGSSVQAKFYDPSDISNYIHFKAPSLTANTDYTLPTTDGSADQILKTDGSGALGWTTISAAPEITGTVSGTLAANEAVVIKSDGTLSKCIETITANSPITKMQDDFFSSSSESHIYDSQTNMWGHLHYHTALDKYVAAWIRSSGGYKNIWTRTGTKDSSGSVSWDTATQRIGNLETASGQGMASVYHSNTGNIFFLWDRQSQSGVKCSGYNLASNSAFDTNELVTGSDGYDSDHPIKVVDCGGQLVVNLDIQQSGDSYKFGYAMVGTVSSQTVTWGDAYKWGNTSTTSHKTQDIIWDSTNSRVIVFGRTYSGGSNWEGVYRVGTISGTGASASISWGSLAYQTGANTGPTNTTAYHDVKNNKIVMLWIDGSNSSKITGKVGTLNTSDNSISWGTAVAHSAETSSQMLECAYDPNTGLGTMWYRATAHSNYLYALTTSVSGTTLTFEAATQLSDSSAGGDGDHAVSVDYDTVSKRVIGLAHKDGDAGEPYYGWTKPGTVTSNNESFVGFSDAAYTNGQTATVKVTGNTSTQSGLTVGKKYYITSAGALTTDSDSNNNPHAGVSLSATKLLVKG